MCYSKENKQYKKNAIQFAFGAASTLVVIGSVALAVADLSNVDMRKFRILAYDVIPNGSVIFGTPIGIAWSIFNRYQQYKKGFPQPKSGLRLVYEDVRPVLTSVGFCYILGMYLQYPLPLSKLTLGGYTSVSLLFTGLNYN